MRVPDCPALMSALAVITAIAMDESPPAPHREDVGERAPTEIASEPEEAAPARRPVPPAPVEHGASRGKESERVRTGVGLGSELVLGALPRPTMGYRGYVERQHRLRSVTLDGRVSLAFARAPLPDTKKLNVVVQTWTARAEGCGGRELFHTLSLEGCLGLTLGAHHSYSTHVTNPRHDLRPWLTLDAGARLRWHLGTSPFFAETYGYVSYVTRPYTTVALDGGAARHEAPRGIGELGIGLGHFFEAP